MTLVRLLQFHTKYLEFIILRNPEWQNYYLATMVFLTYLLTALLVIDN